jgi:hypothetical protein
MERPLFGIMSVIEDHAPFGLDIMVDMPVIEVQRASILVPHDHRHINHDRALVADCVHSGWPARLPSVLSQKFLSCCLASVVPSPKLVPLG